MEARRESASQRVLLMTSIATAFSLVGDSSMYTVLPTHIEEAGILLGAVGILLSANRWIRLPLNGPAGLLFERTRRKPLFITALVLAVHSTAIYAWTSGFWPLLIGRLIWGVAWVGIWIGGNTMILDLTSADDRGRRVGLYQIAFFTGSGSGAVLGGILTDLVGYHGAMEINTYITFVGLVLALFFLPETKGLRRHSASTTPTLPLINPDPLLETTSSTPPITEKPTPYLGTRGELASAAGLLGVNRIAIAGFLVATFGLFLKTQLGDQVALLGFSIGISSLTGIGLGLTTLISMLASPLAGNLSDRISNRWKIASAGLIPGVFGFLLLALGSPIFIAIGLLGTSIASGSNMNLSTSLIGDLGRRGQHGRRLGALFTLGDLASAIGPPLAFALLPVIGISGIYIFAAGLFLIMWLIARGWATSPRPRIPQSL